MKKVQESFPVCLFVLRIREENLALVVFLVFESKGLYSS